MQVLITPHHTVTGYSDEDLSANATQLLRAASYYCLPGLQYLCSKALIQQLTIDNCSEILSLSYECSVDILRHVTLKYIADNLPDVIKTDGYAKLPADLCRDIVGKTIPTNIPADTTAADETSLEFEENKEKEEGTSVEMQQSPEKAAPPTSTRKKFLSSPR